MANYVLVCAESAVVRELCCDLLITAGFNVDTVDDAYAAVAAVATSDYTFIVLDQSSPATSACIRSMQEACGRYSPLIAISPNVQKDCVDDFVRMPISMSTLSATLDRWYHYSRGRNAAA